MRKTLLTAVAMAPITLIIAQGGPARATTTITGAQTNPVKTSTAANGQPDDVVIDTGASVKPTTSPAVTVDSNNTFTNKGTIELKNLDDSVDVLVLAPHTGAILSSGAINNIEDYTATDTNGDGVLDGAWASGKNRFGIHVTGPGTFTGTLTNSGTITVEGNNSFGIAVDTAMAGDLISSGQIAITGNDTAAIRTLGAVTGKVQVTGAIAATGANAQAVNIGGDVTGAFSVYSTLQTTGYRLTTRPSDPAVRDKLLPEDLQQGGSAVVIGANVAGGVFIGAPPAIPTDAPDTQDNDHDGIPDKTEGAALLNVYGQAPALKVGAAGRDVRLGVFGADDNAYGLIIRGTVAGQGVFDNVQGNAVQLGTGDGTVHVDGGIHVVGSVQSTAIGADATSLHLLSGAQTPMLRNEGAITSTIATLPDSTTTPASSHAVLIDQGASLAAINNSGSITAKSTSDDGSALAIVDKSGTLSSITNSGTISAVLSSSTSGAAATGKTVAIDAGANTTGVTLTQNPYSTDPAVTFTPIILGDVKLGTGDDTVNLHAGAMAGALDFGAGNNKLLIDGGAVYGGALTSTGVLNIDVAKGTLNDRSASTLSSTALHVGSEGVLYLSMDPANDSSTRINVAGAATFDTGAKLGINILSLPQGEQTFTAIKAIQLNMGVSDANLLAATPYLFVTTAHSDTDAGTIDVNVRRRTAAEAGFNAAETAAYDAIYGNLPRDNGILSAMVSQTSQSGLLGVYDQLLPDHAGGVTRALSWASEAAGKAAADWPRGASSPGPTRGWTQEIGMGEDKDRGDASAWRIYGFGAVGGLESVSANGSAIGFMTGFTSDNVNNPDTPGGDGVDLSQLSLGAYWRGSFGGFHADVQAGGGYVWAHSRREFIYSDSSQIVHREAEADWSGYSVYARAGIAYEARLDNFVIIPTAHVDYFRLNQGAYTEEGGGDGFDLSVESRTSNVLSLTSSVIVGYSFGDRTRFRPEIELGWRQVLSGSAGSTDGVFTGGGSAFSLLGEPIKGGGPVGRIGFRVFNDFLDLKLDAGGELRDDYADLDVRITVRVVF